LSISLLLAFYL